jgi:hypothetical protein
VITPASQIRAVLAVDGVAWTGSTIVQVGVPHHRGAAEGDLGAMALSANYGASKPDDPDAIFRDEAWFAVPAVL